MDAAKAQAKVPELVDWAIEREIGSGGSGTVYVVRNRGDGGRAALKVPTAGSGWAEGTTAEVTALASMRHQHIVELIGTVHTDCGEAILMEYLPGGSVADLIAARGPVSLGEAVTVIAPIASALAYLHDHGGVHGDVAPGNILFTAAGMPKLADLGLAVLVGGRQSESGTPGFRAPTPESDDSRGKRLRPARDVYSLAALAWYMVTGRIAGPTHQRPPLSSLLGRVPSQLVELLEDALADDEDLRPTAADFSRQIFEVAKPQPVNLRDAVRPEALGQMVTHVVADPAASAAPSTRWLRGNGAAILRRRENRARPSRQPRPRGAAPWLDSLRGVRAPRKGDGSGQRRRGVPVVWIAAAVAAVVAALGAGSLLPSAEPPATPAAVPAPHASRPAQDPSGTPPGPGPTAPTTKAGGPGGTVLQEAAFREDVPKDPLRAVEILTARRDLALSAADPRALRRVHADQGASLGPDLATASQLRSKGLHYAGLTTRLSEASLREGSTRDTAEVAVTSTISPYRIVGADGATVDSIEEPEVQHLVLRLSRHDGGWLISGVFDSGEKAGTRSRGVAGDETTASR
ncbi:serine/threonine-protein kinase [Arthrobacter sp. JSM 101049]|uniref:serine/threonine-protein kinase n=1 Tax=Arthrobacter sp. JSM 101049 TaxID=929097 RepID=UPI003561611F